MDEEFITSHGLKIKIVPDREENSIVVCGPRPFSESDAMRKCSECGSPVFLSEQFQSIRNLKIICPVCFLTDHWKEDTEIHVTRESYDDVMKRLNDGRSK